MITKKYRWLISVLLVIGLFTLTANQALAQIPDDEPEIELILLQENSETLKSDRLITPDSHFTGYIPSCIYPIHKAAYAVFSTGPGPLTVQFHGTRLWSSTDYCPSGTCLWTAYANLSRPGDEIWLYSVTAAISSPVSNWCSSGIITSIEK
ncbi:MAG: hypothetical protein GWN30_12970 [Gammaproteobacteria bacterium]|nr:hypothetical protein [Gammaproteobacteria bacterium]